MLNILKYEGYDQILKMLSALHGLMQSEALTALTITSAVFLLEKESNTNSEDIKKSESSEVQESETARNTFKKEGSYEIKLGDNICQSNALNEVSQNRKNLKAIDYDQVLVDGNLGEKLSHLIAQHGLKMDVYILENLLTFLEMVVKYGKCFYFYRVISNAET